MRPYRQRFELRKMRIRKKISELSDRPRLTVFRSDNHFYAQIIDDKTSTTLVAASTLEKSIKKEKKSNCNINAAVQVAELITHRASEKNIKQVVFDRSGYKYHGNIKAFADIARKYLEF